MVDESSPSSSKGGAGSYHRNQPSFGSLPDDGYGSEGRIVQRARQLPGRQGWGHESIMTMTR